MPRKRPNELRGPDNDPPALDSRSLLVVSRQPSPFRGHERHRRLALEIGIDTAMALASWTAVCHHGRAALNRPCNDWAEIIGPHARDVLEEALATLPPRPARRLGRRVARLDAMFLDKTLNNPRERPDLPWWSRRTARG